MKRMYISGASTMSDAVKAANQAGRLGYEAVTTAKREGVEQRVRMIINCDAILLAGNDTKYALMERHVAEASGKEIVYITDGLERMMAVHDIVCEAMGVPVEDLQNNIRSQRVMYACMIFTYQSVMTFGVSKSAVSRYLRRSARSVKYFMDMFSQNYSYNRIFREYADKVVDAISKQKGGQE